MIGTKPVKIVCAMILLWQRTTVAQGDQDLFLYCVLAKAIMGPRLLIIFIGTFIQLLPLYVFG